jgi:hypothetical protein
MINVLEIICFREVKSLQYIVGKAKVRERITE